MKKTDFNFRTSGFSFTIDEIDEVLEYLCAGDNWFCAERVDEYLWHVAIKSKFHNIFYRDMLFRELIW